MLRVIPKFYNRISKEEEEEKKIFQRKQEHYNSHFALFQSAILMKLYEMIRSCRDIQ